MMRFLLAGIVNLLSVVQFSYGQTPSHQELSYDQPQYFFLPAVPSHIQPEFLHPPVTQHYPVRQEFSQAPPPNGDGQYSPHPPEPQPASSQAEFLPYPEFRPRAGSPYLDGHLSGTVPDQRRDAYSWVPDFLTEQLQKRMPLPEPMQNGPPSHDPSAMPPHLVSRDHVPRYQSPSTEPFQVPGMFPVAPYHTAAQPRHSSIHSPLVGVPPLPVPQGETAFQNNRAPDLRLTTSPNGTADFPKTTYRILGVPSAGFLTVANNGNSPQYSGAIIDILDSLSAVLNFTYTFNIQSDQQYGTRTADGSWNGLIRSLVDNKADIAAADLSITSERESVVDFTTPFYQYFMGILANKNFTLNGESNGYTYLVRNTADATFLKNAKNFKYSGLWNNITNGGPASYIETDQEGIEKVTNGPFAFIMESPGLDKAVQSSSGRLERLPYSFPPGFLAFAVPSGSSLREKLSWALTKIQETGELQAILKRHFPFSLL